MEREGSARVDIYQVVSIIQADHQFPVAGVRTVSRGCCGSYGAGEGSRGVRLDGEVHSHGRNGFAEGANAPDSSDVAAHSHILGAAFSRS